jgi:pimeloyl-ACP methyl ester carboxylesterase
MLRTRSLVVAASLASFAVIGGLSASAKDGAAIEVVPLVLVHGHGADPDDWGPFLARYGTGRVRVAELYAGEADKLKPGDLPRASVICAGYYKESATEAKYGNHDGSIGGIPIVRSDGHAGDYNVSWARRVARIVDGVLRASGSDRVDLALHSMGNLVGRSYVRWLSVSGGKSKVRRVLCIAGPHRGVNALEATVDGLEYHGERDFMDLGELAEMCGEYRAWNGKSFTEQLNDGWDGFCSGANIEYAGITGTGPVGHQVDPTDPTDASAPRIFGHKITGAFEHIIKAAEGVRLNNIGKIAPIAKIWLGWDYVKVWGFIGYPKPHLLDEYNEAMGPGDGTVRLASSRMDQDPFHAAKTWATFEGRHGSTFNAEQSTLNSTFATELAREFLFAGKIEKGGHLDRCELKQVDGAGSASFLTLDTTVSGSQLVSAQVVEQPLGADGKVDATKPATGYACPVPLGAQRAFIPIAPGGGKRTYRVVVYGAEGPVATQDGIVFDLKDGATPAAPTTSLDGKPTSVGMVTALAHAGTTTATTSTAAVQGGATIHVTAASNTASSDPTLRFSFRLDDGTWTPYTTQAAYDSPVLAPGEHRIEARARHANNPGKVVCDDAQGTAIGVLVDAKGGVTIRH